MNKLLCCFSVGECLFASMFVFLCISPLISASAQSIFPKTPSDAEGPFYPIIRQADEDNDLLQISGRKNTAMGDTLRLTGRVINTKGQPQPNALVEIWQTDTNGRYKDRRDTKPGERDPDFQYWGKAECADDGTFSFITLVPGAYPPRPAHIHFKVWIEGNPKLTSQIYFRNAGNITDESLSQHIAPALQTVDLQKIGEGKYEAYFQIVL